MILGTTDNMAIQPAGASGCDGQFAFMSCAWPDLLPGGECYRAVDMIGVWPLSMAPNYATRVVVGVLGGLATVIDLMLEGWGRIFPIRTQQLVLYSRAALVLVIMFSAGEAILHILSVLTFRKLPQLDRATVVARDGAVLAAVEVATVISLIN